MAAVTGRDGEVRQGFAKLIAEQATPEVLRDNPFRVIGLPTDTSSRDLRRQAERIRRDPDVPPAEGERVEAAVRRLRDPVQRLLDELLWHWPDDVGTETSHNAAMEALLRFVEADPHPTGLRKLRPAEGSVRDVEADTGDTDEVGDTDDVGAGEPVSLVELCEPTIRLMATSLRDPATAAYVADRAAALDDPRVTVAGAQCLVEEALLVVPLVALRMAVRAHDAGEVEVATGLAGAVRAAAGADVGREAAAKVLEPAIGRLRRHIEAAEREPRSDPRQGAERAGRLLDRTAADRALVDALLEDTDPLRVGTIDRLADQLFGDALSFYNETTSEGDATRLLEATRALRPSSTVQARIDEGLQVLRETAELRRCWFCQAAPGDPTAKYEVDLYGNVERDYLVGRVTWQTLKVPVPRCLACAAQQRRQTMTNAAGCLSAVAVLVVTSVVVVALGLHPALRYVIFGGALLFSAVLPGLMGARPGETRRRALEFPPLKEKLASGWTFGTRPPGTQ